ncbi:hypothetical protein GCM10010252_45210 [Streptomyces aureoverticillatus]|nr:hypothetical protein GCM10010252_45210 [Streptomyces aureoverticillatus]
MWPVLYSPGMSERRAPVPPPAPAALRRVPVQRRSAERLTRILDACADLLDETGYEDLTTRLVAERAGVPIGSVYRFFGNKRALSTRWPSGTWSAMPNGSPAGSRRPGRPAGAPPSTWCSTSTSR